MKLRLRYLSAVFINFALPWLAYRLAHPHWGQAGALLASALPLIAWMAWDLVRHRHFDALSSIVLIGILLSLATVTVTGVPQELTIEEPMVSGMIGVAFLVSLLLPRPIVFYLARSTMARESMQNASEFERDWRESPTLASRVRVMTLVWGIGLVAENVIRTSIVWDAESSPHAALVSNLVRYSFYGALMLWTFWYRRRIKQDAERLVSGPHNASHSTNVPR
jgi:hypothetical protein